MSKVILSFPYSGAVQAFFAKELVGSSFGSNHGYYKTLWGSSSQHITGLSLTLFSLYDEVIFSPVDNPMPDSQTYWGEEEYYHPDFGLRMPARPSSIGMDYYEQENYIDWVLSDPVISRILSRVPPSAQRQILLQVICDVELSLRFAAEIISSNGRRMIMRRLSAIDPQYHNVQKRIVDISDMVENSAELLVPDFEITSIELLHRIKNDKETRKYGRSVTSILHSKASSDRTSLHRLALESNLLNSKNEQINTFCSISGKICSALGFVPLVGPLFSGISLALGESELVNNLSKSNWIEFKPHLSKLKTKVDIECEIVAHLTRPGQSM